jgi:prophage regulatory protein
LKVDHCLQKGHKNPSINLLEVINMALPETGFLRLPQILGDPKSDPPIQAIIPLSKSTWWKGVKDGRFPKPVKLSLRCSAWRISDIRDLIEGIQAYHPSIGKVIRKGGGPC